MSTIEEAVKAERHAAVTAVMEDLDSRGLLHQGAYAAVSAVLGEFYDRATREAYQRQNAAVMAELTARAEEPYAHAILSELGRLSRGHKGLTIAQLTARVRNAGWDVSRLAVRRELDRLTAAGAVAFSARADLDDPVLWTLAEGARA
jgi:hypothetical protein